MATRKTTMEDILEEPKAAPKKESPKATVAKANMDFNKSQAKIKENHKALMQEEKVEVQLAPMYQPYFGEVMTVGLNGLNIYVPVNGRAFKVPKSYAGIIHGRRRMVDDQITRRRHLANVNMNRESYAGELTLVPR